MDDTRELNLGACGPDAEGGEINLKFSCIDLEGHCRLHLRLELDDEHRERLADCIELIGAIEPAALDRFVEQMIMLNTSLTGCAVLQLL